MFYVYILVNDEGSKYTGYTQDLRKRIAGHNHGDTRTTSNQHWKVVYYEAYLSEEDARRRERRLKDGRAKSELVKRIAKSIEERFRLK